jgi:APA family basic amino acid/polyamine antiporter
MAGRKIFQLEKGALKRVLGVSDLFAIGYGDLGSSIYYALGITALYALGATPIAMALAGVVFVCTALTYAEMTSTFHESGGSASFARHAFNDLISFIAGWGLLLDYIVTIAISAFSVAPYLSYFYAPLKLIPAQIIFTIGIIFLLYFINVIGVRHSTRTSFVLTALTLLTQVVIVVIGMGWLLNLPYIWDHMQINVSNVDWSPVWPEFWKGTAMAMVAYTGIESIAQLGAEAKKPAKTVPKATLITMFVLVAMYLTVSVTALSALSPQELSTKYLEDPLAGIVAHLPFGQGLLGPMIGIVAGVLLFVAANAGLIGASRLSFNMGEYYQLPRVLYSVHPRFRTPHIALFAFALLASLLVLLSRGRLGFLADLYNFGAMTAFFFAHLSLIVMRFKQPKLKRPFRVPFNITIKGVDIPIPAIIGTISTFAVWVLVVVTKPEGRYLGFAWMIIGITMFLAYRHKQKISATGQLSIEKVKMPEFKPIEIKNILVPLKKFVQKETLQFACEMARTHNAKITATHVLEVPETLPLDANLFQRLARAQELLQQAEAIARDYDVSVQLRILRARSAADAILELAREEKFDLLVLGSSTTHGKKLMQSTNGAIGKKILKLAPCRVLICSE